MPCGWSKIPVSGTHGPCQDWTSLLNRGTLLRWSIRTGARFPPSTVVLVPVPVLPLLVPLLRQQQQQLLVRLLPGLRV